MNRIPTDKLAIDVPELAKLLGICRQAAYELVKKPGFPAIRVSDRRIVIPVDKLCEWLDRESGATT